MSNYGTVQTVVVDKVDATPPAIASIKCKNTGKGYQVSITLEETGTGVDKAAVGIGASQEEEMMQQAEYEQPDREYRSSCRGRKGLLHLRVGCHGQRNNT